MTQKNPPIEPLDEQEREFARIVRALPGGDPPPALDARILRAAANAAASSRRPRSRWLATAGAMWGVGGAAAAVLALGVAWQLNFPQPRDLPNDTAPAPAMKDEAEDSSTSVEFKDQQKRDYDNAPPPAPPPMAKTIVERARQAPMKPASAQAPVPEPFAADRLDEHVATRAEAGASADAASVAPITADKEREEDGKQDYAQASAAQAEARQATMQAQAQAGRRDLAAKASALGGAAPPASAASATGSATTANALGKLSAKPERLTPSAWLDYIRHLRNNNQEEEAKDSLIDFHRRYPTFAIPPDLAPLLRE
jgi:Meckel syndrome type 1 protein